MASSMIGIRLTEEVMAQLRKKADVEGKKVSDVARELICSGLASEEAKVHGAVGREVLARLESLEKRLIAELHSNSNQNNQPVSVNGKELEAVEKRLTRLLIKAIRAGASAQFYARAGAMQMNDMASVWSAQINAQANAEARINSAWQLDADCQKFSEWWLQGI